MMKPDHPTNATDLKTAATEFLRKVIAGHINEAVAQHVGPAFRHHNPYFRGDAASLKDGMQQSARENPDKILEIQRVVREGDLVVVHSRLRQSAQGRAAVVVHIFRFNRDRIEELWDIGQPEPETMPNEHGMY